MLPDMVADARPLVSGLDNVHIYVRDVERSRAFYRDLLGIPLTGDEHWLEADLGGVRFALHPLSPSVEEISSGSVSVNFRVRDVDEAAERIRAAGFEAREVMREEYGASFEVVDPDGYRIYLFQPPA
jgi:catechol 2,3-dioxygenase-like lactoylglutathione lyase family enzyme